MLQQARQEMPLAKMHLVRHARGEKGDYVNVNNIEEMDTVAAMSGKMASLYYQEVLVCENCYKVLI